MSPLTAISYFALWLLASGVLAVYFEVESVECGVRVRELLARENELLDRLRRSEVRYNEVSSPDVLDAALPEDFRHFAFPLPRPESSGDPPAPDSPAEVARSGPQP